MQTKTESLSQLPLWECECGRLEFAKYPGIMAHVSGVDTLGRGCPACGENMREVEKDSMFVFEAIGQHFHRDTGYMRPGKDCRLHGREIRSAAFDRWNRPT